MPSKDSTPSQSSTPSQLQPEEYAQAIWSTDIGGPPDTQPKTLDQVIAATALPSVTTLSWKNLHFLVFYFIFY